MQKIGDRGCTPENPCRPIGPIDEGQLLDQLLAGTIFDTGQVNPLAGTIFDTSPSPAADPFAGTIFETTPGRATAPQPKEPKSEPPPPDDIGNWDSGDPYGPSPQGDDVPAGGGFSFDGWLKKLLEN